MFGGMKHTGYIGGVLLAACMFATGAASAADLGGGCCADLEERVAELEATTARKGNRVVSLQITGAVNEAILAWDDGVDSDAYVVTNTGYQTRLSFLGTGQINPDLKAGFVVTLGIFGSPSFTVDQTTDEGVGTTAGARPDEIFIRESKVYIESSTLGRLTLGQQHTASDEITAINVARSLYVDSSAQQVFVGSFRMRDGDNLTAFRFANLMGSDATNPPGDGARFDAIRYDAKIGGFTLSAAWGEDNMWDAALRYAGLLSGRFKVAAGVAYGERSDADGGTNGVAGSNINGCIVLNGEVDCHQIGMSGSIMDMGTGLFIHAAYGINTDENKDKLGLGDRDNENSFLYTQGGIEKKFMPYGATTLFAMYAQFDTGFTRVGVAPGAAGIFENGEVEMWGLGVNQNFESASLDLYLKYNHYTSSAENVSINGVAVGDGDLEFNDFDVIYAGARLTF